MNNSDANAATNLAQTLAGSTSADTLTGGGGSDTITGGAGNDLLVGDAPQAGQWTYRLYNYDFGSTAGQAPQITTGTLAGEGYVNGFNVDALARLTRGTTTDPDDFGVIYTSTLNPTVSGTYTFSTSSDDGSRMIIRDAAGNIIQFTNAGSTTPSDYLNNDYHQGLTERSATINLQAGTRYTIEIQYWENAGGNNLSATMTPPGSTTATNLATSPLIGVPPVTTAPDGADSLLGGDGNDTLIGNGGNDTLLGEAGNDSLSGGDGNDSLSGGANTDTLEGNAGDDILSGGLGADVINGGAGVDTASYADATAAVNVNLTTGRATGADQGTGDTLSQIERVIGSDYADTLTGSAGADTLLGGLGNDTITGGAGADSLSGGGGSDTFLLTDVAGAKTIAGGEDTGADTSVDTLDTSAIAGGATVRFTGSEAGSFTAGAGTGTFTQIERLNLGAGADSVDGASARTGFTAVGNGGNDTLIGGAGADLLQGGDGNDNLAGGAGADQLRGDAGNDTITFGRGDQVTGGTGRDVFTLNDALDNAPNVADAAVTIDGGTSSDAAGVVDRDILDLGNITGFTTAITARDAVTGTKSGYVTLADGTRINFTNIEQIVCFTPGTRIRTLGGARAIETLKAGDLVVTRDSGLQPIRWIGTTTVAGTGAFAPVRIRRGAVPDLTADLLVSPQHRMLIEGYRAELLFGDREVLASARHMVDDKHVTVEETATVTYIHMLFDAHQIVFANGAATESYHPASYGLGGLCAEAREELFAVFPDLRATPEAYGKTARRALKVFEARALAS